MKVTWSPRALLEFDEVISWIASDRPSVAQAVSERILKAAKLLAVSPMMGRNGRISGTREHAVPRTPYLLVYALAEEHVEIVALRRGARHWKTLR